MSSEETDRAAAALAQVRAAIVQSLQRRDPLVLMIGEAGMGKTRLCRAAIEEAGAASSIGDAGATFRDLLARIASDFDLLDAPASEPVLLSSIQKFIAANLDKSHPDRLAVVIITKAHLMTAARLIELSALVELSGKGQGLTVILSGRPELERTLGEQQCRHVMDRVVRVCRLGTSPAAFARNTLPAPAEATTTPALTEARPLRRMVLAAAAIMAKLTAPNRS
jgi:type II secretory pathway predicted ATPase ExeA